MTRTWEEIRDTWLGGIDSIAETPEAVVAAFDRVDRLFGREWTDASQLRGISPPQGPVATLAVVTLGKQLAVLEMASGTERLVQGSAEGYPLPPQSWTPLRSR